MKKLATPQAEIFDYLIAKSAEHKGDWCIYDCATGEEISYGSIEDMAAECVDEDYLFDFYLGDISSEEAQKIYQKVTTCKYTCEYDCGFSYYTSDNDEEVIRMAQDDCDIAYGEGDSRHAELLGIEKTTFIGEVIRIY